MTLLRPQPSSNLRYLRVAAWIGVIGSSSVLLMKWVTDRRVRKSDLYLKATSKLLEYQPTVKLFGPPIYFGNVNFGDRRNVNTLTEMRVLIPVHGSNNHGILFTKATRLLDVDADVLESNETAVAAPWCINQLEVTVDNRPGEVARIPITAPIVVNISTHPLGYGQSTPYFVIRHTTHFVKLSMTACPVSASVEKVLSLTTIILSGPHICHRSNPTVTVTLMITSKLVLVRTST